MSNETTKILLALPKKKKRKKKVHGVFKHGTLNSIMDQQYPDSANPIAWRPGQAGTVMALGVPSETHSSYIYPVVPTDVHWGIENLTGVGKAFHKKTFWRGKKASLPQTAPMFKHSNQSNGPEGAEPTPGCRQGLWEHWKKTCSKGERNLALSAQPRQACPMEVVVSGHENLSSANNSRDAPEKGLYTLAKSTLTKLYTFCDQNTWLWRTLTA